jgi:predicted amidophosphoribosyltransferase
MTMNKSEKQDLLLFDDSPPAGHPDCKCSRCGKTIYELPVSRYYCPELKKELRFHRRCAGLMLKSGQMRASMGRSDGEKKTIGSVVKAALARMGFIICRIVR